MEGSAPRGVEKKPRPRAKNTVRFRGATIVAHSFLLTFHHAAHLLRTSHGLRAAGRGLIFNSKSTTLCEIDQKMPNFNLVQLKTC